MKKTSAQYQREYRQRLKDRAKFATDPTDAITKRPFSEGDPWEVLDWYLETAGIAIPDYAAAGDSDPEWKEEDGPNRGSIGRAERIVGLLLDAASALAGQINQYKTDEINARIAELEKADLSDPDVRKQALADIVTLTKIRDQLQKQVRWTLPQWKVRGD
jgi:hypothetical protein